MPPRKGAKTAARRGSTDDGEGAGDGEGTKPNADSLTDAVSEEANDRMADREPQAIVRRLDDDTGEAMHLDTVTAQIVNEDWIANTYGGGKYRVVIRGYVDGSWKYVRHDSYAIDSSLPFKGSLKGQKAQRAELEERAARISLHDVDGRVMQRGGGGEQTPMQSVIESGVLAMMRESQQNSSLMIQNTMAIMEQGRAAAQASNQMMIEMMRESRQAKPAIDWVAILAIIVPLIPPLLQAMKSKDAIGIQEILTLLEKARPKDEGAKFDDMLTMMVKMREATESMGGGGDGGGSGIMGTLAKVAEAVIPMLAVRAAQSEPVVRAPIATAQITPGASPVAPPAQPVAPQVPTLGDVDLSQITAEQVWELIGSYLGLIETMATLGRRPSTVAAMAMDMMTPQQKGVLMEVLADDGFEAALFEKFPTLVKRKVWMEGFLDALRDEVFGVDEEAGGGTVEPMATPPGEDTKK